MSTGTAMMTGITIIHTHSQYMEPVATNIRIRNMTTLMPTLPIRTIATSIEAHLLWMVMVWALGFQTALWRKA